MVTVTLNRFSGFLQVEPGNFILFVADPKNLTHGLIELDLQWVNGEVSSQPRIDQKLDVWIRYIPNTYKTAKFEVVELEYKTKQIEPVHVPYP